MKWDLPLFSMPIYLPKNDLGPFFSNLDFKKCLDIHWDPRVLCSDILIAQQCVNDLLRSPPQVPGFTWDCTNPTLEAIGPEKIQEHCKPLSLGSYRHNSNIGKWLPILIIMELAPFMIQVCNTGRKTCSKSWKIETKFEINKYKYLQRLRKS